VGSCLLLAYLQKLHSLLNYESSGSQLGPYCLVVKLGGCHKFVKASFSIKSLLYIA